MVHMDVTMDDGGVDVDVYGVGYTSGQVKSAIAGATITPAQVGTASDPVGTVHADSGQLGELSVSDSQPVTAGPVGNEGEFIPVWSGRFNAKEVSTTSSTYSRATLPDSELVVPYSQFSLTNISGYHVSFAGVVMNDTAGETTSVKIGRTTGGYDGTEVQSTGDSFNRIHGPRAPYDGGAVGNLSLLVKCTGGAALVQEPGVVVWGEIA